MIRHKSNKNKKWISHFGLVWQTLYNQFLFALSLSMLDHICKMLITTTMMMMIIVSRYSNPLCVYYCLFQSKSHWMRVLLVVIGPLITISYYFFVLFANYLRSLPNILASQFNINQNVVPLCGLHIGQTCNNKSLLGRFS